MLDRDALIKKIFKVTDYSEFEVLALEVFAYQYENVETYRQFCKFLQRTPEQVKNIADIPFLPVELFKNHVISTSKNQHQAVFRSSGTTGSEHSSHFVLDLNIYHKSIIEGFKRFFGSPEDYVFLALLPSYLERKDASLVHMCKVLMEDGSDSLNGFYLTDHKRLHEVIHQAEELQKKIWLIGVTFALLDFCEYARKLPDQLIMVETGGMKGRRKEIIRDELHAELRKSAQGNWQLCGEYGMTELLSQAYALDGLKYTCPLWMDVLIFDMNDPFSLLETNQTGRVNVIDLANIDSCSFIATSDLGKKNPDRSFQILGRFDHSDIRGCNLMVY
ncbi:MAG: acyl transferase [Flavobacteriales bacterium]